MIYKIFHHWPILIQIQQHFSSLNLSNRILHFLKNLFVIHTIIINEVVLVGQIFLILFCTLYLLSKRVEFCISLFLTDSDFLFNCFDLLVIVLFGLLISLLVFLAFFCQSFILRFKFALNSILCFGGFHSLNLELVHVDFMSREIFMNICYTVANLV